MENVLNGSCAELLKTEFKIIPRFDRCRKGSMTVYFEFVWSSKILKFFLFWRYVFHINFYRQFFFQNPMYNGGVESWTIFIHIAALSFAATTAPPPHPRWQRKLLKGSIVRNHSPAWPHPPPPPACLRVLRSRLMDRFTNHKWLAPPLNNSLIYILRTFKTIFRIYSETKILIEKRIYKSI